MWLGGSGLVRNLDHFTPGTRGATPHVGIVPMYGDFICAYCCLCNEILRIFTEGKYKSCS